MKLAWIWILLVSAALAGCSDKGEDAPQDEQLLVDDDLVVTETTGAIRGVVLDPTVVPVAGALVQLVGKEMEQTTGEDGAFGFSDLEPGTYFLEVSATGYKSVQSSADVQAGVEKPGIVKVQIIPDASLVPFSEDRQFDGHINLAVRYVANARTVNVDGATATRYDDLPSTPTWVQSEMIWAPTVDVGNALKLEYTDDSSGLDNFVIDQGGSPLKISADQALLDEKHFDTVGLYVRVFSGNFMDQPASVIVDQTFTIYTSIYHNYQPPEDWWYIDDGLYPVP